MLHTVRNITPRLALFNPSVPSWLLRPFTSTNPAARKDSSFYPDDATRKSRYKQQAELRMTRYYNDPVYREASQKASREYWARRKNDDHIKLYICLRNLVRYNGWISDQLPWKTHTPLLYEHKVEHYCHGCDWVKRGGLRIWWRRIRDAPDDHHGLEHEHKSDQLLCHRCYVQQGHFDAMPKGYEDVRTMRDISARKKQLDKLAEASSDRSNQ